MNPPTSATRHLFTFILDHAGGTYLSQYRGRTANEALRAWLTREPAKLEALIKSRIAGRIARAWAEGDGLVALSAITNVWCWTAALPRGLALLNIIKTSP